MSTTDKLRPKEIRLTDATFGSLLFRRLGDTDPRYSYCYGPAYEPSQVTGPHRLSGLIDQGWDKWYIFYVEDCFNPPMYAVNGRSFEDAYEEFLCECEHLVKIDEADLEDYNAGETDDPSKLHCDFNSNGTPCDTESLKGFQVQLVEAKR